MARQAEQPTAESIQEVKTHLEEVWARAHAKWVKVDGFVQRTFPLWAPDQRRPEIHPAKAKAIIDHAADTMLSSDPLVHREPVGEGEAHQQAADAVEAGLQAILEQAWLEEMVPSVVTVKRNLCQYGYAVVEGPLLDLSGKLEEPKRTDYGSGEEFDAAQAVYEHESSNLNPYRVRAPHPSRVLLDPMERRPQEALRVDKREAWRIADLTLRKAAMGKKSGGKRKLQVERYDYEQGKKYTLVEVVEYWTAQWHAVMAAGRLLYVEPNVLGFVPFSHAFSGWGNLAGSLEAVDPSYLAEGLLDPIMEDLVMQAQQVSALHALTLQSAFAKMWTSKDASEIAQQLSGDLLGGLKAGEIGWLPPPQVANGIFQLAAQVSRDIEEGTYSVNQAGIHEEGVATVGQQAILSAAAAKKFIVPGRQMNFMFTQVGGNVLRLVDTADATYTVGGKTLTKADIEHSYSVEVRFEAVDPVLQLQERQIAMQEYQLKLISQEDYWAMARKEDTTGLRKRLLQDWIREQVRTQLAPPVAQEMGLADQYQQAKAAQQSPPTPQGGAPGGQGTPMGDMGLGLAAPGGVPSAAPPLPGTPQGNGLALREMRKPLTPEVVNPNPMVAARRA